MLEHDPRSTAMARTPPPPTWGEGEDEAEGGVRVRAGVKRAGVRIRVERRGYLGF